ncbi:hypothetical protein A2U01_0088011, partial [Trifolium medium]|nr:hypothetical protein [Trifolium medium]
EYEDHLRGATPSLHLKG